MSHTRFPADHQEIIPKRARSYQSAGLFRYKNSILSYGTVGATSLLTTVADLARWDHNFDEPRVGDEKLIARFLEPGKLNDGKSIDYALGLGIGNYRGAKTVEHSGGDAGFRSYFLRLPAERLSVIVLSNTADSNPGELARKVVDIYLGDKLKPEPPKPSLGDQKEVKVDPATLDPYVGVYRVTPGLSVTIAKENGRLTAAAPGFAKRALSAASDRAFFIPGENLGIEFKQPVNGHSPSATVHYLGEQIEAQWVVRQNLTAEQAKEYAGDFYSGELGVIYTVSCRGSKLMIRHPRGEDELVPIATDGFDAPGPLGKVTFTRAATGGRVTGLHIDGGRVLHVRFARVDLKPSE
jgi:hypothetical protein